MTRWIASCCWKWPRRWQLRYGWSCDVYGWTVVPHVAPDEVSSSERRHQRQFTRHDSGAHHTREGCGVVTWFFYTGPFQTKHLKIANINSRFQASLFWRRLGNFNLQTNGLYFSQVVWTLNLAKRNDLDVIWQDDVKFALWESAGGILSLPFFWNYDIFISGTLPWGMRPAEAARFHLPLCPALWTASYSWCTGPLRGLHSLPSPSCSLNWQRFVRGPKYRDEKNYCEA